MKERLQKVMAHAGVASRRQSEQLIAQGDVTVNGQVVSELGTKVDLSVDRVTVQGRLLQQREPLVYFILHKPRGYVTTAKDDLGRKTVLDIVRNVPQRIYPVGRLDYDSEGLLLLTNDGFLAHRLMHPRYEVWKTYQVEVIGRITDVAVAALRQGVPLDDGVTSSAKVTVVKANSATSVLTIAIHEGRNRQVRRMLAAMNYAVNRLVRIQLGPLRLGNLACGHYRTLTPAELASLKQAVKHK